MNSSKTSFNSLSMILGVNEEEQERKQIDKIKTKTDSKEIIPFKEYDLNDIPKLAKDKEFQEDYEYARKVLHFLTESAQKMLLEALNEAQLTTHPESIAAANQTIDTVKSAIESLMKIHDQVDKRNKEKDEDQSKKGVTNNFFFEGTTQEFLRQINKQKEEYIESEARVLK